MTKTKSEQGFTKVPNELLDMLMSNLLTSAERQVLMCVARKTYGFHKEWDAISLSQFEKNTGITRRHINNALKTLVAKRILAKRTGNAKSSNQWQILIGEENPYLVSPETLVSPRVVAKRIHTKEIYTKERRKNNKNTTPCKDGDSSKISPAGQKLDKIDEWMLRGGR